MCAYTHQELDGFSVINDALFLYLRNSQKEVTEHTQHMECLILQPKSRFYY